MRLSLVLLGSCILMGVGCGGEDGKVGPAGGSCSVVDNGDGTKTITCEDGTSVVVADGEAGYSCSVVDNGDGTKTITCEDGTTVVVADGEAGDSCSVADNGDGTKTVSCEDGTTVVVADGTNGDSCVGVDNGDGTFTITCGTDEPFTVTDPGYVPPGYAAADGIRGGTAYSQWWVTQADGAGSLAASNVTVGSEFVRCKTCHGWDGMGNTGSYANRTGQSTGTATRPDVTSLNLRPTIASKTPQELFDLVRRVGGRALNTAGNGHPDYSTVLTDAQVWNLVKFMREEWIFPDELYYLAVDGPAVYRDGLGNVVSPTLTYYGIGADGDATRGDTVYATSCASCHGADGTDLNMAGNSVGKLVRTKPHEVWHKVKFGQITSSSVERMEPGMLVDTVDFADMYQALTNTTTYPDIQ